MHQRQEADHQQLDVRLPRERERAKRVQDAGDDRGRGDRR